MQISQSQIDTYKSLFRGRGDVYAVRWEKDGRGGYMPAYKVDWDDYNRHKASGGTFLAQRNSCFIEQDTFAPVENQWAFLETIKKIPKQKIDSLHLLLSGKMNAGETLS